MKTLLSVSIMVMLCSCFLSAQNSFGTENLSEADAVVTKNDGPLSIDARLRRLAAVYESQGEAAALQFAKRFSIPYEPGRGVRVELKAFDTTGHLPFNALRKQEISLHMAMLTNRVQALGGVVMHKYGLNMSCRVPLDKLSALASSVETIHPPFRVRTHVVSEGVNTMDALQLSSLSPFRAEKVHVCVLDVGFENYEQLIGSELPDDFTVHTVRDDNETTDGYHGTACAEIVYDVVPDAKISGMATYYVSDIFAATDWILANDVDVISASIGHYYSPGDGTGYESELAKMMRENGTIYVTSAGNEGNDHWSGTFNDPDGDGWHNFSGSDEILSFYVPAYNTVDNLLRWNDWGAWDSETWKWAGATQDYDLYLFYYNAATKTWVQVPDACTFNRQPAYSLPIEEAGGYYASQGAYWGVGIYKHNAAKKVYFDLFVFTHSSMEYANASGSIGIPGDSPDIIAVGATDALTDELHSYSSQGPTLDGRIKPDVCAPAGVSTSNLTFGNRGFYGTSAACPHMAGLIALFKSRTPFAVEQIVNTIYARVLDLGTAGFDNLFGRGRIRVGGD